MANKDYYEILGVSKSATAEEIKTAFRKKAHEHHPDKGGDQEKFKELNEAYQVLGSADKRKQYDQFGSTFQNGAGGFNWQDFAGAQGGFSGGNVNFEDLGDLFGGFGDIFGFGGGNSRRASRSTRGRDLQMNLTIEFNEAIFGAEKDISFERINNCEVCSGTGGAKNSKLETCPTCNGRGKVYKVQRTILGNMQSEALCQNCEGVGQIYKEKCSACHGAGRLRQKVNFKVKIPAGINSGESIRLAGQGEAGTKGGGSGDLFLEVLIKAHKKFIRQNYDIKTTEKISVKQAILGDKISVDTVYGPVTLKIPEGTQSHTVFRLREHGVQKLHSRGKGDQLVEVIVSIPKSISKSDRKLIEALNF